MFGGRDTASPDVGRRRQLLIRALRAQATTFRPAAVVEWFRREAPWVAPLWVEGILEAATVNSPFRGHYPSPCDLVFVRLDGSLERYDPKRHGRWSSLGTPVEAPHLESTKDSGVEGITGRGMRGWPSHGEPGEQERRAS